MLPSFELVRARDTRWSLAGTGFPLGGVFGLLLLGGVAMDYDDIPFGLVGVPLGVWWATRSDLKQAQEARSLPPGYDLSTEDNMWWRSLRSFPVWFALGIAFSLVLPGLWGWIVVVASTLTSLFVTTYTDSKFAEIERARGGTLLRQRGWTYQRPFFLLPRAPSVGAGPPPSTTA